MATTKIRVTKSGDEPKKLSPQDIASQTAFAKNFALRKNLLIGQNAYVGSEGAPFVDASGKDITGVPSQSKLPYNTITDIRKIPAYVAASDIKYDDVVPYYIDQQTGDAQPIHPDIARSSRFNPNRGKTITDLMAMRK